MAKIDVTSILTLAKENRVMIRGIKDDIKGIKNSMDNLSNHYSKRLPGWATLIITLLASIVTGLLVAILK